MAIEKAHEQFWGLRPVVDSCRLATFSVPYSRWATWYSVSGDLPWIVTGSGRRLDSAVGEALCRKLIAMPLQAGYGLRPPDHKGESQRHITSHQSRSGRLPPPRLEGWRGRMPCCPCGHDSAMRGGRLGGKGLFRINRKVLPPWRVGSVCLHPAVLKRYT